MENKRKRWLGVGMLALLLSLSFSLGIAFERVQGQSEQLAQVSVKLDQINHTLLISAHAAQPWQLQ